MIVVSYDVDTQDLAGKRRLRNVAKICEAYGCRVQNSVFELMIDPAKFVVLKNNLLQIIDQKKDSVRFYKLGSNWRPRIETMGKSLVFEQDGVIIL